MNKKILIAFLIVCLSVCFVSAKTNLKNCIYDVQKMCDFSSRGIADLTVHSSNSVNVKNGNSAYNKSVLNSLKPGDVFCDVNGNMLKVVSVTTRGKETIIETTTPYIRECYNYVNVPEQYVEVAPNPEDWTPIKNECVTQNGDWDGDFFGNDSRAAIDTGMLSDLMPKNKRSFSKSLTINIDAKETESGAKKGINIELGLAIIKNKLGINTSYSLPYVEMKIKGWPWEWRAEYHSGYAKVEGEVDIQVGMGMSVRFFAQKSYNIALYDFNPSGQGVYCGLYFKPKFYASVDGTLQTYSRIYSKNGVACDIDGLGPLAAPHNFHTISGGKKDGSGVELSVQVSGKAEFYVGPELGLKVGGLQVGYVNAVAGPYISGSAGLANTYYNDEVSGKFKNTRSRLTGNLSIGAGIFVNVGAFNNKFSSTIWNKTWSLVSLP